MSAARARLNTAFVLAAAPLVALWAWFALHRAIPFWQQLEDYAWYSLSLAFTIESRMAGMPAQNGGFLVHPGVPYAYASWLGLRMATPGQGSAERVLSTLQDPEGFWLMAKAIALALSLLGVLVYRQLIRQSAPHFLLACLCYFAFSPAVLRSGLMELTVESFALPFIVSSYALAYRLFRDIGAGNEAPLAVAAGIGALAAIGVSLKIYYLAPTVGVVVGLACGMLSHSLRVTSLLRIAFAAAAGFALVGHVLIVGTIGRSGVAQWLEWNLGMLQHAGLYGSGQASFMDVSAAAGNLRALIQGAGGTFLPVVLLVAVVVSAGYRRPAAGGARADGRLLFAVSVIAGASLNLLGVLKHYGPHYAMPFFASLPCLLVITDSSRISRRFLSPALVAAALLLTINVRNFAVNHEERLTMAQEVLGDLSRIRSMSASSDRPRVWGYLSASPAGIAPLLIGFAGSEWIATTARQGLSREDAIPRDLRTSANWGLVILPKIYYPAAESIPRVLKGQFDFMETDFRLCPADSIIELNQFFVVTPAPRAADGSCGPDQK